MLYCENSGFAEVNWKFGERKGNSKHSATPIDVSVFGVPNPAINDPVQTGKGFDLGIIPQDDFIYTFSGLDQNTVHFFTYFDPISIETLIVDNLSFAPTGNDRITLPSRLYVRNGSRITITRRPFNAYQRLTSWLWNTPATIWDLEITDRLNRKITDRDVIAPTYTVNCGGCPPGTIDCGGCCADCGEISSKLRAIDVKL